MTVCDRTKMLEEAVRRANEIGMTRSVEIGRDAKSAQQERIWRAESDCQSEQSEELGLP